MNERITLMGCSIDNLTMEETLQTVEGFIHTGRPHQHVVVNVDKLTYAGNLKTLASLEGDARHTFVRADICDRAAMDSLLAKYAPRAVVHFAAESHVDRSIHGPADFVQTNVVGTFTLLEAARAYWNQLGGSAREGFRFHHVSTDEVYGSLSLNDA